MAAPVRVEKVAKLPFAGTKAEIETKGLKVDRFCTPEQFEIKCLSHLQQIDTTIANVMMGDLVEVDVPLPVDATQPTAQETRAMTTATAINTRFEAANARLRDFLISSVEGILFAIISAKDHTGQELTGKQAWDVLH
jgi:hypothetical protein